MAFCLPNYLLNFDAMRPVNLFVLIVILASCKGPVSREDLFNSYFEPYLDLVSGQQVNERNVTLLDGMKAYSIGEYEEAIRNLNQFSSKEPDIAAPYMYMGVSYLALNKPFEAELMFDHLDNLQPNNFIDQSQWYTALCLLRSDQIDRCKEHLNTISTRPKHTYKQQAKELLADLDANGI